MPQPISVMIVDDQAIVRKGMKAFLEEYDNISVVGEAASGVQAIALLEKINPDVVILDLLMPGMDGIETTKRILDVHPNQRIIILTADFHDDKQYSAIQAGAYGYVRKDANPAALIDAIQKVCEGVPIINVSYVWKMLKEKTGVQISVPKQAQLTDREIQILELLAKGHTDADIARKLFLSTVTVRTHVSRMLQKLGLRNRVEAALYGLRTGMVTLDEPSTVDEIL